MLRCCFLFQAPPAQQIRETDYSILRAPPAPPPGRGAEWGGFAHGAHGPRPPPPRRPAPRQLTANSRHFVDI